MPISRTVIARRSLFRSAAALAVCGALALGGCGGSGSSGPGASPPPPPAFRDPPPDRVQEIVPAGTRIDARADNYFPFNSGDDWVYNMPDHPTNPVGAGRRTVTAGPDANGNVTVRDVLLTRTVDVTYRVTADGLLRADPFGGRFSANSTLTVPPGAKQLIGTIVEFAQPFYPAGAERKSIREGTWDADIDNDGHPEGFRAEFTETFVGFETIDLPTGPMQAAHFKRVSVLDVLPSKPKASTGAFATLSSVLIEDSWFVSNVGLVRVHRSYEGLTGIVTPGAPYTLWIATANVGGQNHFERSPDGTVIDIPLVHSDLVYDRTRSRYYASVPASAPANATRIAIIDAASGSVAWSDALGLDTFQLALSADDSVLYAAQTSRAAKLDPVTLALVDTFSFPVDPLYGQLRPGRIAVSPTDPNVIAVAIWSQPGWFFRHAGVMLMRNWVPQPVIARIDGEPGADLIVFGPNGTDLYGRSVEGTPVVWSKLEAVSNGVVERLRVQDPTNVPIGDGIAMVGTEIYVPNGFYRTSDLAFDRGVNMPGRCRPLRGGTRLACAIRPANTADTRIAVYNIGTRTVEATPLLAPNGVVAGGGDVVQGPPGQVAIRDVGALGGPSTRLILFTSPQLP